MHVLGAWPFESNKNVFSICSDNLQYKCTIVPSPPHPNTCSLADWGISLSMKKEIQSSSGPLPRFGLNIMDQANGMSWRCMSWIFFVLSSSERFLFPNGLSPASFSFDQQYWFTPNKCEKYPSIKVCWDSNSQPLHHSSLQLTTKPGPYPKNTILVKFTPHLFYMHSDWLLKIVQPISMLRN